MLIGKVRIELKVEEKLFKKHGVTRKEIEGLFLEDAPYFFRTKHNLYAAVGFVGKYITAIFSFERSTATVITAYSSSDWQVRLYRKKKMRK